MPAGGVAPGRGHRGVPDALRLELHARRHLQRRTDAVLPARRGPADELPVRSYGVAHRRGGRRGYQAGIGGEDGEGGDGRGEGRGDEAMCRGMEGEGSRGGRTWWDFVGQSTEVDQ